MNARQVPNLKPGDPEWATKMSASKVAAMVGLSPYESRFSLWHKMAGNLAWDDGENEDEKRRGHYLEPALRQWLRDQHPELTIERTGTWVHNDRPWQIASPDGLAHHEDGDTRLVECKTSANDYEWGEPGSDEIAPYYKPQIQWALDVLGLQTCHLSVLTSYLTFVEYRVDYDPAYAAWLRDEAQRFMASLALGNQPNIDEHGETYKALRRLHPGIEDTEVEVPEQVRIRYGEAQAAEKAAKAAKAGVVNELAHLMGDARIAKTPSGLTVAYRKPVKGSTPCITPARGLAAAFTERTAS